MENVGGGRTHRSSILGYVLKADVKHYFETVDHELLISIIFKRICDEGILWLIKKILANHKTSLQGKGMPLGNLTSQFFANIYLNELDQFVKHELKAKFYIRYVDDFVILGRDKALLEKYMQKITRFLAINLKLEMHPEKSRVIPLRRGITLLGFRVFYYFKLLKTSNQQRIWKRLSKFEKKLQRGEINSNKIRQSILGWEGYAKTANTYLLRKRVREEVECILATTAHGVRLRKHANT
ncbi:MAG: reverse transcriptase domain-containing protein [Candidatus Micrarchaeota archaeon]